MTPFQTRTASIEELSRLPFLASYTVLVVGARTGIWCDGLPEALAAVKAARAQGHTVELVRQP